ncbi:MAG: M48 family metallopeptidase [Kiritimatiellia bacterium]
MRNALNMLVATGCALLFGGCATTDYVSGLQTNNMYSLYEDAEMGRSFRKQLLEELQNEDAAINRDPVRVNLLREITANIASVAHIQDFDYETTYVNHPEIVNAFALPGGAMIVFEGLMDPEIGFVKTVDELAAIIGHELAHVNCRHSTEQMTREMLPNLLLAGGMIWASVEGDEDLQLLFGGAMLVYDGLFVTRYSRIDELEADRVGMMYMAQAGYDPRAAVRIWERLSDVGPGFVDQALSIFSTHPLDYRRAAELRIHLPEALALYEAAPVKRDGARQLADLLTFTP